MKSKFISLFLMVFSLGIWAQSDNQNYIKTTSYKIPITNEYSLPTDPSPEEAVVQVNYYDGLGRPIQTINKAQGTDGMNVILHVEYDNYGHQTKDYLPYVSNNVSINYDPNAEIDVLNYYNNEYYQNTTNPYSETLIEKSPLNRIMKSAAPGNDWAMESEHEIKYGYGTNTTDEVLAFSVNSTWNSASGLYDISLQNTSAYYLPNQLYKKVTRDENHRKYDLERTEEFVDKQGRIILKRVWVIINPEFNRNPLTPHDTYYVYDQFGNLTYVIPPAVPTGGNIDTQTIESLCYQYKYDEKNRLVAKKIPSKQWEYIIYDKLDRVRATGPALSPFTNLTGNGWLFTKYDNFNRPILTAWKQVSGTFNDILRKTTQDELNSVFYLSENASTSTVAVSGINYYYTHQSYPNIFNAYHVLTVNYYDNYRFINSAEIPTQVLGQNVRSGNAIKEIPTGSWVRIIEATNNYKANITFTCYKTDRMSSPIKSKTIYNTGGYTQAESVVNFAGEVGQTITKHKKTTTATEIIITENFTYSEQGRLLTHTHQINNDPTEFLTINTYDKLGQLTSKEVGGDGMNFLQNVNFTYNIRGWLTDINKCGDLIDNPVDDLFSFKLAYNQPFMGASPLFNGNISESYWHTRSDDNLRNYEYSYDGLNRLKNAVSDNLSVDGVRGHFNETLSYDKNGNITHLLRTGGQENQFNTLLIDDLTYSYDPNNKNQLKKVVDLTNSPQGFKDDSNGTIAGDPNDDYLYDLDGNMIKDENKNITSIVYNHLNLPTKINFGTGSTIAYTYDATGVKLKKVVTTSTTISTTEYINGFQYNNDAVQFFPHAEGYVNCKNVDDITYFSYVYQYTDHLGNIRMSYAYDYDINELVILEENNYYPFGLKHGQYNTMIIVPLPEDEIPPIGSVTGKMKFVFVQVPNSGYQYQYNGKEWQDELGYNMYDMDMRQYDPAIARWVVQDPVEHLSMSPYNSFDNNPVFWKDPSGADSWQYDWEANDGTYRNEKNETTKDWKKAINESENEVEGNDDIIFTDKKGNKLATYRDGKKEITNVTLPIDNFGSSPNADLNKATGLLTTDVDMIGIGIGGGVTDIVGFGAGLEFIYFLDGKDKGQVFSYTFGTINLGFGVKGFGVSAIAADFLNGDSNLTSDDYLGTFNYGGGNTPVAGMTYFWGNNFNDPELYPGMGKIWRDDKEYKQTWSGYNITAPGPNASAVVGTAQYMYTPLVNDILQQCGLQKK